MHVSEAADGINQLVSIHIMMKKITVNYSKLQ